MNKKEWKKQLETIGWPNEFGGELNITDWGSCQYSDAYDVYCLYFIMRKDLSEKDTLGLLGISFDFEDIRPFKKSLSLFAKNMRETQKENAASDLFYSRNEKEKLETIKFSEEEKEKLESCLEATETFDDMFECLKNEAWDLWGAAPYVFKKAFKKPVLKGTPKAKGIGPVLNVLSQNQNFEVGIMCALLKDRGLVKNESSFADFDT